MSKTDRAAALLESSGLGKLLRRGPAWRGALVVNYHRIGDGSTSPYDRTLFSATAEGLDAHLEVLARHFEVVGPGYLTDPSPRRLGRAVLITFDDGYRDNYEQALPILRGHGLKATFFIATGFIDRPRAPWWDEIAWMVRTSPRSGVPAGPGLDRAVAFDEPERERAVGSLLAAYKGLPDERTAEFLDHLAEATGSGRCDDREASDAWMSWDMVRELRAAGMWVGAHTVDHPVLARTSRARQQEEILGCRDRLEAEIGERPRYFSYPIGLPGSFDAVTRELVREAGFELAFGFSGGYIRGTEHDLYALPRCSEGLEGGPERFLAMVTLPQLFARW
ncbi:MAG: polysaccharide deacetylase family protein [Thermoleophilaceae bacterium]